MKRWFCGVFAWWGVVGLLLSLVLQAGVNHQRHASWNGSVDCGRESVSTSPRAWLGTSTELMHSRAGPLESLAIHYALTTMEVGSPWLDKRGPPGGGGGPWVSRKAAGQTGSSNVGREHVSTTKFPPVNGPIPKAGFCNTL